MKTYFLTREAMRDLSKIEAYISKDNPAAAVKLIENMMKMMAKLSQFPGAGTIRFDLYPGIRSFVIQNYLLFYREVDEGIEIVRVLHAARDIEAEFE